MSFGVQQIYASWTQTVAVAADRCVVDSGSGNLRYYNLSGYAFLSPKCGAARRWIIGRIPPGVAGCRAVRRACAVKCWLGAPWRPAVPRRGTPRKFRRSCWAGEGIWAYQEGQMGQKMVCFGQLRPTRSRQDESIEVGEVGSKRPSGRLQAHGVITG